MRGLRIAILGSGRSGLAVAEAALAIGAEPKIFDEGPGAPRDIEAAQSLRVPLVLSWKGDFDRDNFDLVVTSPGVPRDNPKLQNAVSAGIDVIGEVEFAYRISKAPIVAITGTNGKSTTTVMTYLALSGAGSNAILCGNIYGSGLPEAPLTEAAMRSRGNQVLVAEISSFQLEWIRDFKPVAAGITTITPDHLNRYGGNFAEYANTKQRIFENQTQEQFAVIRANDAAVTFPSGPTVLTFGRKGQHARLCDEGMHVLGKFVPYETLPFEGEHNYANAALALLLASTASAAENGTSTVSLPEGAVKGLTRFRGLVHRMELVGERSGVRVINNSMCTNPDAVIQSTRAVGRPTHLLMGGINKDLDFAPLRDFMKPASHHAYLFGRHASDLNEQLGGGWPTFDTMQGAFEAATNAAKSGEAIMLAPGCASMDQFEDFRERGDVFKEIAKEWLQNGSTQGK